MVVLAGGRSDWGVGWGGAGGSGSENPSCLSIIGVILIGQVDRAGESLRVSAIDWREVVGLLAMRSDMTRR